MSEVTALPLPSRLSGTVAHLVQGLRAHALLYLFATFVSLVSVAESAWLGLPIDIKMVMIFSGPVLMLLGVMIFAGLALELVRLSRSDYQGSALAGLWSKVNDDYLSPRARRQFGPRLPLHDALHGGLLLHQEGHPARRSLLLG